MFQQCRGPHKMDMGDLTVLYSRRPK